MLSIRSPAGAAASAAGPSGHRAGAGRVTDLQGALLPRAPVEALQHLAVHAEAQHLLGQLVVLGHGVLLGVPPPREGRGARLAGAGRCTWRGQRAPRLLSHVAIHGPRGALRGGPSLARPEPPGKEGSALQPWRPSRTGRGRGLRRQTRRECAGDRLPGGGRAAGAVVAQPGAPSPPRAPMERVGARWSRNGRCRGAGRAPGEGVPDRSAPGSGAGEGQGRREREPAATGARSRESCRPRPT